MLIRTYEPSDLGEYLEFINAANADNPDWIDVADPSALDGVLLKAPAYRRSGHFLLLDGRRIVGDALGTVGGGGSGFLQWNLRAEQRTAENLDPLAERAIAHLQKQARRVHAHARPETEMAAQALARRGFRETGTMVLYRSTKGDAKPGELVRPMEPEDLAAVASLLHAAFAQDPTFSLVSSEGLFGIAALRQGDSGLYLVADDGGVAGCLGGGWDARAPGRAVIDFLAVDASRRRKGLGRALLSDAVRRFASQGATSIDAVGETDNERARGLYESFGFAAARPRHRVFYRLDL